ncbi:MAG: hypothetical protein ACIAQU_08500 [Phycisphaerales bacterium JB064]
MFWPFRKSSRRYSKTIRMILRGDPKEMALLRSEAWLDDTRYRLIDDGQCVTVSTPAGTVSSFRWDEIEEFAIVTNSLGPFCEDVWYVVRTFNGQVSWPNDAAGDDPVLEKFWAMPGFDSQQFSAAMGSTDDAEFLCWRRETAGHEA